MTLHAVLAHKDFEFPTHYYFNFEPVYAFSEKEIKTNLPLKIYKSEYDSRLFGELGIWKWLYENEKSDWYCLHHYRRFFEEYHEHVCLPTPIMLNCSLLQQLAVCHSPKLCEWLQKVLDPNDFNFLNQSNKFYPYNVMQLPRELLAEWLKFIVPIINKLIEVIGITDYDKMIEFVKADASFTDNKINGQEITAKNCDPIYQSRIYAFILERLTTLFFAKLQGIQIWHCDVHLLELNQKI